MKLKALSTTGAMLLMLHLATAQNVLIDKKGTAHFFSEAPIEDIEATNDKAMGALDLDKGTVAVSMMVSNFHFEKSLMEEHFNENYLETEKYPKASYKGSIIDFSGYDFSKTGQFSVETEGQLEIHGVTQPLKATVDFDISETSITAKTLFKVTLKDHKVKIPKVVVMNIAEVVDVDAHFTFQKP